MGNEVRIDLTANADKGVREVGRFRSAIVDAGKSLVGTAKDANALDEAIDSLNSKVGQTRLAVAASPDDKGLWKQLRKEERELNKLSKLRDSIGGGIADALSGVTSRLAGPGAAIGVGMAAAAAPFIGAALGAAVIGGVGIGGIVGGIAAAAQDPRVKSAGGQLAESLKDDFAGIGEPFIEPLLDQMGRMDGIGGAFFSNLTDQIAPLAGHLDNITDGAAGFARNFDVSAAVAAAGPLIDIIGEELPEVAESLTDAFETISEEGDGMAVALRQTFDLMESGITTTADFIGAMSSLHAEMTEVSAGLGDMSDEYLNGPAAWTFPWLIPLASALSDAGNEAEVYLNRVIRAKDPTAALDAEMAALATDSAKAAEELLEFSDAIEEAFGKQMDLDEATSAYKQGIKDLTKELSEGERTLDDNTQAGRANSANAREWLQNIEEIRKATIAQTGDVKGATKVWDEQIAALRRVLLNLGYDKQAVEDLINAYRRIPKIIETEHRIKTTFYGGGGSGGESHRGEARASGGPVAAGRTYLVGEEGPELVTFGAAGMVHTAAQTRAMMSGASGGGTAMAGGGYSVEQLASALAMALQAVSVVMDGHVVGRVQAGTAGIYARS